MEALGLQSYDLFVHSNVFIYMMHICGDRPYKGLTETLPHGRTENNLNYILQNTVGFLNILRDKTLAIDHY